MSLPDTAEYWNDVKRNYPYVGPNYFHIPGFDCGHRHLHEAKFVDQVNCRQCKKALKDGIVKHNLLSAEEHKKRLDQKEKSKLEHKRKKSIERHPNNPVCECGYSMVKRTNKDSHVQFWGCSHYPMCKKTKSL